MQVRAPLLAAAFAAAALVSTLMAGAGTPADTIVFGLSVHGQRDQVIVIRPDGSGRRVLTLRAPGCAGCVQVSRDGSRFLTAALIGKRITTSVERLDGTGYTAFRLPGTSLNLGPGAWSPDGRRIAFEGWDARGKQNGLYTGGALDGSGLRRLTTAPGRSHDVPLVYSPDGAWILFVRSRTGDGDATADLYAVPSSGGRPDKLNPDGTGVHWNFGSPGNWSTDSRTVAFAAFRLSASGSGVSAVFTASPRGGARRRITSWGQWTTSARFSPDGKWIVFDRPQQSPGHDLLVMRPDGSHVRTVVDAARDGRGSCCAAWSPDGTQLVLQRGDPASATLWSVSLDGTGLREISRTPGEYPFYAWVP